MADQGQTAEILWSSEATLELLGTVRLENGAGDDLTPRPRKTRALLALLALAKGPVPRSRLINLLWGDRGEEQGKDRGPLHPSFRLDHPCGPHS